MHSIYLIYTCIYNNERKKYGLSRFFFILILNKKELKKK